MQYPKLGSSAGAHRRLGGPRMREVTMTALGFAFLDRGKRPDTAVRVP